MSANTGAVRATVAASVPRTLAALLLLSTLADPSAAQRAPAAHGPLGADEPVRGWTILSDREPTRSP